MFRFLVDKLPLKDNCLPSKGQEKKKNNGEHEEASVFLFLLSGTQRAFT